MTPALNQRPQVNLARSTVLRMWMVFGCALGTALYSALSDNFASLAMVISALSVGLSLEALALHFGRLRAQNAGVRSAGGSLGDGSAAASLMVLVLLLPHSINPLYAALGAAFAMLLVKYSYGGLGANWVNPALGAWLFIRLSWPALFEGPLPAFPPGSGLDLLLRNALNRGLFSLTGAELPPGYMDLFLGGGAGGIIADRGFPVLVLGTLLLTAVRVNRAWIPGLYLAVYALLVRSFGAFSTGGVWGRGMSCTASVPGGPWRRPSC
jgi:electron transport complex protein RnfD